ncbi:MAG: Preprotein translocase subunit SecD, partial [Candidatus Curtissbacteria bacterium GW2011_GWC1_44_33]
MHLSSPAKKLIGILVLFIAALFISLPTPLNLDLKLGLDLAGGSHLVFEADTSKISPEKVKDAVVSLKEVVERRVNLFGISEPVVQTSSFGEKERIIVELPGIQNTQEAAELIGRTAQLVFAEVSEATSSGELKLTDLSGADLERAAVDFDQTTGKPV